jgi:hypothetical protein
MKNNRSILVLFVLALGCTLVSFTIFTGSHTKIMQNVFATNTTAASVQSTNGSSITLGNPQTYTEYETHYFNQKKTPIIANGTHEIEESFAGHEILNGSIVATHGKVFLTNSTAGANRLQTVTGYDNVHGITLFFRGINHIGADGTIRAIGTLINSKGMVGIFRGEIDKNGNAIAKFWFWK